MKYLLGLFDKITIKDAVNALLFVMITLFAMACGSNASDYATEYGGSIQKGMEMDSLPENPIRTTLSNSQHFTQSASAVSETDRQQAAARRVADTSLQLKSATEIAEETAKNAATETEKAIAEAEQRLADLKSGKIRLGIPPAIPGTDSLAQKVRLKSPALPAYKCPCEDVHAVIKGTTPSGVVAYYKGKYPMLSLKELERINQPGIFGSNKFKPGLRVCLKRKKC